MATGLAAARRTDAATFTFARRTVWQRGFVIKEQKMTAESEDFRKHCAEKALYSLFVTMKLDQHDPELGPTVKQIRADTTDAFNNGLVIHIVQNPRTLCASRTKRRPDCRERGLCGCCLTTPWSVTRFRLRAVEWRTYPERNHGKNRRVFCPFRKRRQKQTADYAAQRIKGVEKMTTRAKTKKPTKPEPMDFREAAAALRARAERPHVETDLEMFEREFATKH